MATRRTTATPRVIYYPQSGGYYDWERNDFESSRLPENVFKKKEPINDNNTVDVDLIPPQKPATESLGMPAHDWRPPSKAAPYLGWFIDAENQYGLPRYLLARVAQAESNYNPNAESHAGAIGLMQIIPRWHPGVDPLDPKASIYYAAQYLRKLYNRFGTWPMALAAYNWGQGNLSSKGFDRAPRETRNYVAKIAGDLRLT